MDETHAKDLKVNIRTVLNACYKAIDSTRDSELEATLGKSLDLLFWFQVYENWNVDEVTDNLTISEDG